jgi:exopolysaccharide biosynthesis polyprenyl glycosylphosphotransferase
MNRELKLGQYTDSIFFAFAYFSSFYIKYNDFSLFTDTKQIVLFAFAIVSWVTLIFFLQTYKDTHFKYQISKLVADFSLLVFLHLLCVSFFWMVVKGEGYSRMRLAYFYLILFFLGISYRFILLYFLRFTKHKIFSKQNFAVVGVGAVSSSIVEYFSIRPEYGMKFKGYIKNIEDDELFFREILEYIKTYNVKTFYCCNPYIDNSRITKILETVEIYNCKVKVIIDFESFFKNGMAIEYHDYLPVINLSNQPPSELNPQILKRAFDLVFSIIVMILGFPFFYLIGLITMLSSKGPIFYKSERVGFWGKKFYIYKFRSMYVDADEIAKQYLNGDMHSRGDKDPRITKWGQFMRKTRIDELPQFYNVLRGDMSVVGPRPLPQYDIDMIKELSPIKHNLLLSMKPGLTSIGQIKFGYASNPQENIKRVNLDLIYLNKFSLKLDLWIIFNTIKVMLQAKGR